MQNKDRKVMCILRSSCECDAIHGTALKEEVEIHASLTWATLHSKNMPALSTVLTESSGNALMSITQQQREDICSCGTPYLHYNGKTLTADCLLFQALKNKMHGYARVCFSQLCFVVKY